ncbi:MAG TPA: EAL domain-containing protein [Steroidobacteraceae bacterium]|nr:EAL domain-containing protein [Steroidobacteraceae bacterium]
MQSESPLVDFDAVCQKVRAAVEPNRSHAVSLHDETGDVLWLSESSMGPDEHNAVREAAEAFGNPAAAPILSYDLGDSKSAVMVRAVNARRAIVGLIMIVMDTRIVAQGAPKLMTPKLQRALVQFAGMRPDRAPAAPPEAPPSPPRAPAPAPAPATSRSAPPTAARVPSGPPASAPLSVGPRTIAAQLEQIVSRGPVRSTPTLDPGTSSRPASYVSHVGAARAPSHSPAASAPHAAPDAAQHVAPRTASRPAAHPTSHPARPAPPAISVVLPPEDPVEKQLAHKGVPPEIDRLNAAMRKSPIVLHVQRLVPLSKGSQLKRYEVLLRSGSEDAPNSAPHAMLKAAVENGLGSMIDRRVVTELIGWLVRHPDTWHANEVMFSVNLTTTALHDEHFIKFVELCLAKSSLPKGTIAFEVDAPTALTLADKISDVATALHRLGCPLVLDDFALRTECFDLLRLPGVRYLKLASDLTSRMRSDKVSQAAITAVVQMARVLGMHTVAKRTDTAAEQEWLTALGVDFVQSNAISPAVAIDSLHKPARTKI